MPFDANTMPFDAIARQLIQAIAGDLRGSRCSCFRLNFNILFDVRRFLRSKWSRQPKKTGLMFALISD
jgi:hypothetical protein